MQSESQRLANIVKIDLENGRSLNRNYVAVPEILLRLAVDRLTEFRELTQRRLDRGPGDCQVYWEHDAKELLEKTCPVTAAIKTSERMT